MQEIIQKIPIASEQVLLHLCRHFKNLPAEEISKLLNLQIKMSEIEDELKLVGSKFYDPPFKGVYSLIGYVEKNWHIKNVISFENDILICSFSFSRTEFSKGIGNDGLVSLSSLDENELSKVYKKDRKTFVVNAYPTSQIFPTWDLIVISKSNPIPEILTIYPGTYAPPFPMDTMNKEFFQICDEFWKMHALIESK